VSIKWISVSGKYVVFGQLLPCNNGSNIIQALYYMTMKNKLLGLMTLKSHKTNVYQLGIDPCKFLSGMV
jgi:hypothetical protein